MADQYLMAVDAGTGSVRAVLFTTEGKEVAHVQREWIHVEDPNYPGSMDFNWEHNWDLASLCIREVIKKSGIDSSDIAAISTTSMREGIVLYNDAGRKYGHVLMLTPEAMMKLPIWFRKILSLRRKSTGYQGKLMHLEPCPGYFG